jgi:energy-coupling factor transporter ATP-binding protein EcfA2
MELVFKKEHRSIKQFEPIAISDFSIITGLNGSGKTHLLQAIENGSVEVKGIPSAEIIYYNYSDFSLNYDTPPLTNGNRKQTIDVSKNTSKENFAKKSSALSQRLTKERNEILQAYKILPPKLSQIEDSFLHWDQSGDHFIWTDEELSSYKILLASADFVSDPEVSFVKLSKKAQSIFESTGLIPEISDFELLRSLVPKCLILQFIKQTGYNSNLVDWSDKDLENYISYGQNNPEFNIWDESAKTYLSQGFINLAMSIQESPNSFIGKDEISFLNFRREGLQVFADLEIFLKEKMPSSSFKMLKGLSGRNGIFTPIPSESGFLDLYQLSLEEKQYQISKKQNDYNKYLKAKENPSVSFLDDEQFIKTNGDSPVSLLNEALRVYDCNGYEFRASQIPDQIGIDFNSHNIHIQLFNKKKGYSTDINSLSSGERTLLALTFYVYKLKFKKRLVASLLLLDEIDSSLHPFMSQRLIEVLYSLFHQQMGLKIVLCTHSPSTVAFAPCEDSLYVMKADGAQRLIMSSKDAALKELTHGVPSFSVNYENRRQVFVESKYDVEYYEALYKHFRRRLHPEISLNFIASGDAQKDKNGQPISNCTQVVEITKLLRDGGNKFIWGIIDWDMEKKKPQCEFVKVLGWRSRYSIESYILDPLLVAVLVLIEKFREPRDFGLQEDFKLHMLFSLDELSIQGIIDNMIRMLNFDSAIGASERIEYSTISGKSFSLPKNFTELNGHDLETKYLKEIPELNSVKKGKENELKNAVIKKVIQEYEEFAPIDLLQVLLSVQEI